MKVEKLPMQISCFLCLFLLGWAQMIAQGLEIDQGTDVNLLNGGSYLKINNQVNTNELLIDANEIMSRRSSGLTSILYLNREGGDVYIGSTGNSWLRVDGSQLTWDGTNNQLGIRTSNPNAALDVNGPARFSDVQVGGIFRIDGAQVYYNDQTNRLGLNTTNPSTLLDVNGQITCSGRFNIGSVEYIVDGGTNSIEFHSSDLVSDADLTYDVGNPTTFWDNVYCDNVVLTSDMRQKKNITSLEYGLQEILQLSTITYQLKEDPFEEVKLGLSAQELLTLTPEVVKTEEVKYHEDGTKVVVPMEYYGVKYIQLIPILVQAIKDLHAKINQPNALQVEQLIKQNESLREQNLTLSKSIDELKHMIHQMQSK